jgi:hypothetical protein
MRILAIKDAFYVNECLFNLSPREEGHENSFINWSIFQEIIKIRRNNLLRNRKKFIDEFSKLETKYNFDLFKYYLKNLIRCFIRLRLKLFFEGVSKFKVIYNYII